RYTSGQAPMDGGPTKKLMLSYLTGGRKQVNWNSQRSNFLNIKYGVRQGSVLGPLLFILLTADLPDYLRVAVNPEAQLEVLLYADDTSIVISAPSWEQVDFAMGSVSKALEAYSNINGLHLNVGKTQTLRLGAPDTPSTATLDLLGVTVSRNLTFGPHHEIFFQNVRKRIGVIRRLCTTVSRGPLLTEIARAIVIGKLQTSAWVTRSAKLSSAAELPHTPTMAKTSSDEQLAINDLARILLGVQRADRLRVVDLLDRSHLPSVNEILVKQAAISAWKAMNVDSCPLERILECFDERTRSATICLKKPVSTNCVAAVNLSKAWSLSKPLREACTLSSARRVAKTMAELSRSL
ncbi:Putative RNA-directed DNA polymerase from transposon BS, partial [Caligus rogercresseyi]